MHVLKWDGADASVRVSCAYRAATAAGISRVTRVSCPARTVTWRVTDWNDMTDELVWERLAVSVGQFHSILPRLHGEVILSLSQLYPLLIAPWFWHGYVTSDIRNAHLFDAWLMSSAAIAACKSENVKARSGASARIFGILAVVKAEILGFSRRT